VSGPSNGSLTLNTDGSFSYAPSLNFNGTDSFTYRANDAATAAMSHGQPHGQPEPFKITAFTLSDNASTRLQP